MTDVVSSKRNLGRWTTSLTPWGWRMVLLQSFQDSLVGGGIFFFFLPFPFFMQNPEEIHNYTGSLAVTRYSVLKLIDDERISLGITMSGLKIRAAFVALTIKSCTGDAVNLKKSIVGPSVGNPGQFHWRIWGRIAEERGRRARRHPRPFLLSFFSQLHRKGTVLRASLTKAGHVSPWMRLGFLIAWPSRRFFLRVFYFGVKEERNLNKNEGRNIFRNFARFLIVSF